MYSIAYFINSKHYITSFLGKQVTFRCEHPVPLFDDIIIAIRHSNINSAYNTWFQILVNHNSTELNWISRPVKRQDAKKRVLANCWKP